MNVVKQIEVRSMKTNFEKKCHICNIVQIMD